MLEFLKAPNHVVAFRVEGELTARDYDLLIAELENKLQSNPQIAVYADMTGLRGITREALLKDLRYGLSKLGQLPRFPRSAIVTDQAWLRSLAHFADAVVPVLHVRAFSSAAREQALEWAAALDDDRDALGLQLIATTRPDTFGVVWNGKVTVGNLERVTQKLEAAFESQSVVRVLARLERLGGIEPSALLDSTVIHVKLLGLRKVERYALVGDQAWLPTYTQALRAITGIDMRHFAIADEARAWSWLEAQPASTDESTAGRSSETRAHRAP